MASRKLTKLDSTWELTLYDQQRTPQDTVLDTTEIGVTPSALHYEFKCPICLDTLKKTMTTKECLHRFCSDCIIKALRTGNKECPTCRRKLVSKRSLRPDRNFDSLISKLYPSQGKDEPYQEHVLAQLNKSQAALVNSIAEGTELQSQNRPSTSRKNNEEQINLVAEERSTHENPSIENPQNPTITNSGTRSTGKNVASNVTPTNNPPTATNTIRLASLALQSGHSTPSQSPNPSSSNVSSISKSLGARPKSNMTSKRSEESKFSERTEQTDTERGPPEPTTLNKIELVLKPHPTDMAGDNQLIEPLKLDSIRYMKTAPSATVDHLCKYLSMRLAIDLNKQLSQTHDLLNFSIYILPTTGQYVQLKGNQTLEQVNDKYWKVNKPLEMYYSWKKTG